jgi:hypothetical protein
MGVPTENDGSIERVDLDGRHRTVIVPPGGTHTPKQIHLDKGRPRTAAESSASTAAIRSFRAPSDLAACVADLLHRDQRQSREDFRILKLLPELLEGAHLGEYQPGF